MVPCGTLSYPDKKALEALLGSRKDMFDLAEHPPESCIKFIPPCNMGWDHDHNAACVYSHLLDALYLCAENKAEFKRRVNNAHKKLKYWNVGFSFMWKPVKKLLGWDETLQMKTNAEIGVALTGICSGQACKHAKAVVDAFVSLVFTFACIKPTQQQLDKSEHLGKTLLKEWRCMLRSAGVDEVIPEAVDIYCRKQYQWCLLHQTLYWFRTEGRERCNKVHNKWFWNAMQFVEGATEGLTGDRRIHRKATEGWVLYAAGRIDLMKGKK